MQLRHGLIGVSLALGLAGCAGHKDDGGASGDTLAESSTTAEATEASTGTSAGGPSTGETEPAGCDFGSPTWDAACLEAIRQRCLAEDTETGCESLQPIVFGQTYLNCGWVAVASLSDAESCEIGEVSYRCESYSSRYRPGLGLVPQCDLDAIPSYPWSFSPESGEFVSLSSVGPFGPWNADHLDSYDTPYRSCADNIAPPAPPQCECVPAVCAALGLGGGGSTGGSSGGG